MVLIYNLLQYNPIINHIEYNGYKLAVLRLDLIHPEISGNKWFKLKYNLQQAKNENKNTILTFGGAFSNHIAATAFACKEAALNCIGIIRGEESSINNPTLSFAKSNGMALHFISRNDYQKKRESDFLNTIEQQFPNCYVVPEGGDNSLGQKGCEEILNDQTKEFDFIFCAYGTGTTFKGLAKSALPHQKVYGINVLKYEANSDLLSGTVFNNYHFGGYAKHTDELLNFKRSFEKAYHIPLDYVYTAKAFYAAFDFINQGKISKDKKIVLIHSGGLQGNKGYEERYHLTT